MKNKMKLIAAIILVMIIGIWIGRMTGGNEKQSTSATEAEDHVHEEGQIWTCSMHPQIRQPEPGQCPICGMDLIPVAKEEEGADRLTLKMSERALKLANVETAVVKGNSVTKILTLNGRISEDERIIFSQTSHFPGRIEKLYVSFTGEFVKAGQPLASYYSPELVSAQEELFEAKKYEKSNPVLLQAARTKLKLWKLNDEQIRNLEEGGKIQEEFPILADRSGYVIEKKINAGDYVQLGQELYRMADLSSVWVLFDAYEDDLIWIKEGQNVEFTVKSLPGKKFKARISYIDPVIDEKTRVAEVRAELANPNYLLKPEMFVVGHVEARLVSGSSSIVVPRQAVLWTGRRSVVYIKVKDSDAPAFRMREVVLGPALGESYIIQAGLEPGEEIVVNGTYMVDAASELADKPSMMDQEPPDAEDPFSDVPDYRRETPDQFKELWSAVMRHYLDLQKSLVDADVKGAGNAASKMLELLPPRKGSGLPRVPESYWKGRQSAISRALEVIKTGESIDLQRKAFIDLSKEVARAAKAFGGGEQLYLFFCPMANQDQGAYWINDLEKVANPYFGEMMLNCGSVVGSIQE